MVVMLNNLKPLGGFIENTIRPLIEESKSLLKELEKAGIDLKEGNIKHISDHIFRRALLLSCLSLIQNVAVALIIGVVAWKICQ